MPKELPKGCASFAFIGVKDADGNMPAEPNMIGIFVQDQLVALATFEDMWNVVDFMYEHLPPRQTVMSVS